MGLTLAISLTISRPRCGTHRSQTKAEPLSPDVALIRFIIPPSIFLIVYSRAMETRIETFGKIVHGVIDHRVRQMFKLFLMSGFYEIEPYGALIFV